MVARSSSLYSERSVAVRTAGAPSAPAACPSVQPCRAWSGPSRRSAGRATKPWPEARPRPASPSGRHRRTTRTLFIPHPNRRVAALEAKQKLVVPQGIGRPQGLSQEDQVIAKRLEKLRQGTKPKVVPSQAEIEARLAALRDEPRGPIPSTEEMEDRLAVLQGRVPPSQAPRPVHQPPDTRTQAQQAEDLLTQLAAEVVINESCDQETPSPGVSLQNDLNRDSPRSWNIGPAELAHQQLEGEKGRLLAEAAAELREENTRQERILALAKRLAVLRGLDPEGVTLQNYHFPDSDEDEEEAIQRVLQQLTEEAALDEASGFNIPAKQGPPSRAQPKAPVVAPNTDSEAEEELPWCCICNEDATLRCYGCDGDLYCLRCFREGHDAFERKEHRTSVYHPPCTRGEH
ncbi:abscission/NoCut checkpoint regulator isoform X1 [Sarcophilus harrisii]|uniref:abscission/NoCut checkpoint regulator isoform X1 n=1 Tax=Sarcophilus harrisii TaxID=9305 RepID=UPI001301F08C|nr:abscission/NoCut checkpoint regulator isoform X1 [Sarcophilus harrisii]